MIIVTTTIKKHLTDLDGEGLKKEIENVIDKEKQKSIYQKYAVWGCLKSRNSKIVLDENTEVPILEIKTIWTSTDIYERFMEETKESWRKLTAKEFDVKIEIKEMTDKTADLVNNYRKWKGDEKDFPPLGI